MILKKAKFLLYYRYNMAFHTYEIRVENKDFNNSLLIAECDSEVETKRLTRLNKENKRRPIKLSLVNFGKYFSQI